MNYYKILIIIIQKNKIIQYHNKAMSIEYIEFKNVDDILKIRAQLSQHTSAIGLSDMATYYYTKQGGLFSKKQQRSIFYFFQGLNTNPQNLSIFLRDQLQKSMQQSNNKQKLVKGQFIIFNMFTKTDCVIQINIPGNFQIYKIQSNKKQLISNLQIQMMYVSSVIRTIYAQNIVWGRIHRLFKGKSRLEQFKQFIEVFIRVIEKYDIYINSDFENQSHIKGSQTCSIIFEYIKQKCIIHHAIQYLQLYIKKAGGYQKIQPKIGILLAQLYNEDNRYAKSLSIVASLMDKYSNDPYLLYYQSRYMLNLMTVHEALMIINSIIQYNHFEIWLLAADIHMQLKNYSESLVCLNHASKFCGKSSNANMKSRNNELIYAEFEKLGRKKIVMTGDDITRRPKIMMISQNPLSLAGHVEDKFKCIFQSQFWKMNESQKLIYRLLHKIRSRLQNKKFQQLIQHTFQENNKQFTPVVFKKGMTQSMFIDAKGNTDDETKFGLTSYQTSKMEEQLPNFLQQQSVDIQANQIIRSNRNLSIIPQLESVIQNSHYQQRQKQSHNTKSVHTKKEMSENFFKLLTSTLNENEYWRAQCDENYPKILPVFNKLRTVSKINNYYTHKMFEIMLKTGNYKSIIVLIAETLDLLEQTKVKKIQILPYWIQKYIFAIVQQKGLKFLNQMLEKLNFYDEAVLDAIELAKSWKIKGCSF